MVYACSKFLFPGLNVFIPGLNVLDPGRNILTPVLIVFPVLNDFIPGVNVLIPVIKVFSPGLMFLCLNACIPGLNGCIPGLFFYAGASSRWRVSFRKVDARLPGKGNSNSHGARPVHLIITMIKWFRTSRLSIKNSL